MTRQSWLRHVLTARARKKRREGLLQLLADMDEEFGPIPDDVKERVDREWEEIQRRFDEFDRSS
jgi:hypothetical protein